MATSCEHFKDIDPHEPRTPTGCEDCMKIGAQWVHLRLCLMCGHVGCCDQSPNTHATKHFHASKHAMMRSFEPGEDWGFCYVDDMMFSPMPTFGLKTTAHP